MQSSSTKWEIMLASGCTTGREFAAAWQTLKQEACTVKTVLNSFCMASAIRAECKVYVLFFWIGVLDYKYRNSFITFKKSNQPTDRHTDRQTDRLT